MPQDLDFAKPVADWTKSDLEEGVKAVLACRRIIDRLAKECARKGDGADEWEHELTVFLEPRTVLMSAKAAVPKHFFLGKSDAEIDVLNLVAAFHNLEHLKLAYSLVGCDSPSAQWNDPRTQRVVGHVVNAQLVRQGLLTIALGVSDEKSSCASLRFRDQHVKILQPVPVSTDVNVEAVEKSENEKVAWNDGDVASDPVVQGQPQQPRPDGDQLLPRATGELNRYCKFLVVNDVMDAHGLATVLPEPLNCIFVLSLVRASRVYAASCHSDRSLKLVRPRENPPEPELRVWWWDSAFLVETSESFCKSHNPWGRAPPFVKGAWCLDQNKFDSLCVAFKMHACCDTVCQECDSEAVLAIL